MKDGMLLILGMIICITMVVIWGRPVVPSGCLIAKGRNTESKSSHAAQKYQGGRSRNMHFERV